MSDLICTKCFGYNHVVSWYEGTWHKDVCYVCNGLGFLDHETYFSEQLKKVAETLAIADIEQYKQMCDKYSDLNNFNDCALQNNLTSDQYSDILVYSYSEQYFKILSTMKKDFLSVLIAWNNYIP